MTTEPSTLAEQTPLPPLGLYQPRPMRPFAGRRLQTRLQDLAIVLERLFTFYEAMHHGKPLANADEKMVQLTEALARSTTAGIPAERSFHLGPTQVSPP